MSHNPVSTFAEFEPGNHVCCLYETDEECRAVLRLFIRYGLERGEKVIFIADELCDEAILDQMEEEGLAVGRARAAGQLQTLTIDETYLNDGVFDPDKMIEMLRAETETALAEGYIALRVTGAPPWGARGATDSTRLLEYDSKLNELFCPGSKCLGLCRYDRRRFDAELLLPILARHPTAVIGMEVCENFYYVPQREPSRNDTPGATLRCWLDNLSARRRAETARDTSEERYHQLVDSVRDVIFTLSVSGCFTSLNPAFETITGWRRAEWEGKHFAPMMHPEDLPSATDLFKRVLNGERPPLTRLRIRSESGRYLMGEFTLSPEIVDGAVVGVLGVACDITERHSAERELRARLQEQAVVAEFGQRALAGVDLSALMDEATTLLAQTLEVEYSKVLELLPGENGLLLRAGVGWKKGTVGKAIVGAGSDSQAGYTLLSREPVVVEDLRTETRFSGPPLLTDHGVISGLSVIIYGADGPFGVLGVHTRRQRAFTSDDIHFVQAVANVLGAAIERDRREIALRENEERFRQLAENIREVFWLCNPDLSTIYYISPAYEEVWGRTCRSLYEEPRSFLDAIHPEDQKRVRSTILEEMRTGYDIEFRIVRPDGSIRRIRDRSFPIRDESNRVYRIAGIAEDVTERRDAEQALRESNRRVIGILESITDAFFALDREWRFTYLNSQAERMLRRSSEDLLGQSLWDEFPQAVDSNFYRQYHRAVDEQVAVSFEEYYPPFETWYEVHAYPSPDGLSVYFRDITPRKRGQDALKRQAQIIDQVHDAIISTDLDGFVTSWNKGAERTIGYSSEEALGKHVSFIYAEERPDFLQRDVIEPLLRKGNHDVEVWTRKKSGEVFCASLYLSLIRNSEGAVTGMIGYSMDITERKRAEESLHERELAYRTLAENLPGIVYRVYAQEDHRTHFFNTAAIEVTGYSEDELASGTVCSIDTLIVPEDRGHVIAEVERAIEENRSFALEYRLRHKDGTIRHMLEHGTPIVSPDGQANFIDGVIFDITERKHAEEEKARLAAILEATTDFVGFTDRGGRTLYLNRAGREMIGLDPDGDISDLSFEEYYSSWSREIVRREGIPAAVDTGVWTGETALLTRDGREIPVSQVILSHKDAGGKVETLSTIARDMTRSKQTEQEIRLYQAQLRSLASQLSLLEERERRRIANGLHDHIAQPLALTKMKVGAVREILAGMHELKDVDEIRDILEQTIRWTRSLSFELSPPVLYELGFEAAVEWLAEQTQERHGIQITVEDDGQTKALEEAVQVVLFAAVRELLTNVVKHARATAAQISIEKQDDYVQIVVEDDGVGFDAPNIESQRGTTGGFGLFSIRERLNHLGGQLVVHSEPGRCTRATVLAPVQRN